MIIRMKLMEQCGLKKAKEEFEKVSKDCPKGGGGKVETKSLWPRLLVKKSTRTASQSNNVLRERSIGFSNTQILSG